MVDDDYCYLITTGRRSGRPHEIEIWYVRDGDTLYFLAGAGHRSDWVRNLAADPLCRVRIGSDAPPLPARGRLLESPDDLEEERHARDLVFGKYQPRNDGDLTGWREAALPVALDLEVP